MANDKKTHESILEECLDNGEIELTEKKKLHCGIQYTLYLSSIAMTPDEAFKNIIDYHAEHHGIDENFTDSVNILVELHIDDEDEYEGSPLLGKRAIISGWHTSGQYTDEDYEASFSGSIIFPNENSYDEAKEKMFNEFQIRSKKECLRVIEDQIKILQNLPDITVSNLLGEDSVKNFMRLLSGTKLK